MDELVERVADAIEKPFLPHGYELKRHLLRSAARAAIEASRLVAMQGALEEARREIERIKDEANTVGPDWRETASMIDSICLVAEAKIDAALNTQGGGDA